MSSLKDIMDVDVEPLESQAYRRSREAAQQQASLPSMTPTTETPSSAPPPPPPTDDILKGKTSSKGRKPSSRLSKPTNQAIAPQQPSTRRRSSTAGEGMDYFGFQAGGSNQASTSASPQQSSSRGSESAMDVPVKYTPITGRISRAKKGVPVHTCELCRPAKTFTRAEHLRRHQLSHQKPSYPCTFEGCERAFHRPDLLARHLHRHETQGGVKTEGSGSRESSVVSGRRSPPLTVEPPVQGSSNQSQISPTDSLTPRTSGSGGSTITASSFDTITGPYQQTNFQSGPSTSHKRTASEAQLGDPSPFSTMSPSMEGSRSSRSYDRMTDQNSFASSIQTPFDDAFTERGNSSFNYSNPTPTTPHLPLLQIPEESFIPALSYNNSPWCSSASDSTYSTQSDNSRGGWAERGRSASIATLPDWSGVPTTTWSPHGMSTAPQDMRPFRRGSLMDQYDTAYTSPRVTPPPMSRQLLDVPVSYAGPFMELVGTPALSMYSKPLAQRFSASTSRMSHSGMELEGRKKGLVEHQLGTFATSTALDPIDTRQPQLDIYLSSYWQNFHRLYPIIHHPTFNPSEDTVLISAMAAIGTQYHDTPEARKKGAELNESCKKRIELCLNWDLQTMQAILLTEIFTRFRGRKTNVRLSRHFESLYLRLMTESDQINTSLYNQNPGTAASADAILDRFGGHANTPVVAHVDSQCEWYQWLTTEARQRLLSACFMFDVHQSMYHEQSRSKINQDPNSLICLPSSDDLWNLSTASEWQAVRSSYPPPQPLHLIDRRHLDIINTANPFVQSLLICWLTTNLTPREDPTYPNNFFPQSASPVVTELMNTFPTSPHAHTYLALYHTPLHDLLAIAGDTWVFSQKLTPPSAFHSAQSRLKTWSTSLAAAQATYHACQVLSSALAQPFALKSDSLANGTLCISDYWSLYTCALICWAFGHKHQNFPSSTDSLSRTSSSSELGSSDSDDTPIADNARLQALEYSQAMLELGAEELLTSKANTKGDTYGVVDAVRQRLERESIGNKCGMLVDAIAVLSKIKRGRRGKWF